MMACLFPLANCLLGVDSVNVVGFIKSGDDIVAGEVVENTHSQSGSLDTTGPGEGVRQIVRVHHIEPMSCQESILIFDEYTYTTNAAGQTAITGFDKGYSGALCITNTLAGWSVTSINGFEFCTNLTGITIPDSVSTIGDFAFADCTGLISVTIPGNVIGIGMGAFSGCTGVASVYFQGNAPHGSAADESIFVGNNKAIVYYLPGTTGWRETFGGRPTAAWKPDVSDKAQPPAEGDGEPAPQK